MKTLTRAAAFALLMLAAAHVVAQEEQGPVHVVRGATAQLQARIATQATVYRSDRGAYHRMLEEVLAPAFDLPYSAQLVLGRHWRSATPEQRARFQSAFAATLVRAYGDALLEQELGAIQWRLGAIDEVERSATVRASVPRAGASALAVTFDLRLDEANRWRAYDIAVEDVSLVASFRGQYSAQIRRSGIDALIAHLEGTSAAAAVAAR